MTLLLAAALLASVVGYMVIHPIVLRRAAILRDVTSGAILDAEARKKVTLTELKEIEYDFLGGKLDEADYRAQREKISREALAAIRAAEAISGRPSPGGVAVAADDAEGVPHECGYVNPADSRFCSGCGVRLG